ncbi:unnamed protein product [Candida verbasci]|uniref:R3H domain-containing protein n=1 Tax=Candida verbasci TaxID=1227364 RepID=A0A9W4TWQ8_9ASCO|nr:unnamed protein product [Candida verbasci]
MTDNSIPQAITIALTKQQDRLYILHLEKDLIKFIKNSILGNIKHPQYIIQSQYLKNSYYRLLSHQLCSYYNLQHWNTQQNEILVTPSTDFNYQQFLNQIESNQFIKLIDIAPQFQIESNSTTTTNSPTPEIQQPKLKTKLIKKPMEVPKTTNINILQVSSESSSLSTSSQDLDIESRRALYKKMREKIFEEEEIESNMIETNIQNEPINKEDYKRYTSFQPPMPYYPMMNPYYNQSPIIYDAETERRILNQFNPYIIIPDDNKRQYKGKRPNKSKNKFN